MPVAPEWDAGVVCVFFELQSPLRTGDNFCSVRRHLSTSLPTTSVEIMSCTVDCLQSARPLCCHDFVPGSAVAIDLAPQHVSGFPAPGPGIRYAIYHSKGSALAGNFPSSFLVAW